MVAVIALLMMSIVGGGVFVWMKLRNASRAARVDDTPPLMPPGSARPPPGDRAGGAASAIVSWVGNPSGKMCFADANGDGVADLIGYGTELLAVDIRSGAVLWREGGGDSSHHTLFCDGRSTIVSYHDGELTLRGHDPASGRVRWSAKLSDRLESVAFGDDCLVARATDHASFSIDAKAGGAKACRAASAPMGRYTKSTDPVHVGALEVQATSTGGPGTPRLLVRATGGRDKGWETKLANVEASNGAPIAARSDHVYVAGTRHGGSGIVVAILDARTGAIVRTREELRVKKNDSFFMKVSAADTVLLVESFGMVHAYDSRTLAPLWWAGTMWASGE